MRQPRVLAMVLAGGQGSRMEVLTQERAKPAMPFAGVYRLIDLPLSNLRNSGISDVWVVAQYEVQSIIDALVNGRPWDLDRTHGGLRVITPQRERESGDGWHEGNADAIYKTRDLIRQFDPDALLVLSADHIYRLDYNDAIDAHLRHDADVTVVTTRVPRDQASNHAVVEADDDGLVNGFAYKPDDPATDVVATEIFVYKPDALLSTLEALVADLADDESTNLEDFGHHLLPALVEKGTAHAFPLDGYWKDVGRPEAYFAAHMDLLEDRPELHLDDPAWPIFTLDHQRMPARISAGARIDRALVSPGCVVNGTVRNAVLGPGVIVEAGATVEHAIILHDTLIRENAEVRYAIVDRAAEIGKGAQVGEDLADDRPATDDLVLVGMGAKVHGRRKVKRGERIGPASSGEDVSRDTP
jgi:glucose-1-phosphate adenylyltransferase